MKTINHSIGFIGAGNMAEAITGALIKSKIMTSESIFTYDISEDRLQYMKNTYGIKTAENINALFKTCDVVVLAVKPQAMASVLENIVNSNDYSIPERKLIMSIAAGIKIKNFEDSLYTRLDDQERKNLPIIRVMPNTPSLVLEGMSGMCLNRNANLQDSTIAKMILESMGSVLEFTEEHMDAVTAISGSGPAYFFYFIESMIEAGINLGLKKENALKLALTTMKGASKLLENSSDSPETLRRKVTSPGGTTEAAIKVFDSCNLKDILKKAVSAASERSKELS